MLHSSAVFSLITVKWIVFITIIFSIPPSELVLWSMVLVAVVLLAYWQFHTKRHFRGPSRADEEALSALEKHSAAS